MDSNVIIAIAALATVVLALFIDLLQTRAIRGINARFEAEAKAFDERGSIGEQFGGWLLAREKEGEPTNLEACASLVGKQIANSFSMGLKGIASGESRTMRSVEKAVLEGVQTPETKALLAFMDKIGLDHELAGPVLQVLQQRGLLDGIIRNNGGQASSW